jgi:hypothetical protein
VGGVCIANKEQLKYTKIIAILLSCIVASLTLCNLLTVATHSIKFEIPDENDFSWALNPTGQELLFLSEFSVSNHGAYDIDDIDINAELQMEMGQKLIDFSKNDLVVSRGSDKSFDIMVSFAMDDISLVDWLSLIYKDTVLRLVVDVDASYMFGLIYFTANGVLEYPWNAPLENLSEKNNSIVSGLFSVVALAGQGDGYDINDIEDIRNFTALLSMGDFEYNSDWGYSFLLNTSTDSSRNKMNISCMIEVPFLGLGEKLAIGFRVILGLPSEEIFVKLQEVNINFVQN